MSSSPHPVTRNLSRRSQAKAAPQSAIRNSTACGASHCCSVSQSAIAFIALGSNLGDARQNVLRALALLQSLSDHPLLRSSLCKTKPVDCPPGSPLFINAVAALIPRPAETPRSLLAQLQSLEKQMGRLPKKILNEPRLIDLDLLAFGGEIIAAPDLVLPHPRAHLRRFVLQPWSEIAPDYTPPGQIKTVAELLQGLP
jgi:2-amino-4-hydroxy-6-hydroxymethyldihydropteridine diphosphokinase